MLDNAVVVKRGTRGLWSVSKEKLESEHIFFRAFTCPDWGKSFFLDDRIVLFSITEGSWDVADWTALSIVLSLKENCSKPSWWGICCNKCLTTRVIVCKDIGWYKISLTRWKAVCWAPPQYHVVSLRSSQRMGSFRSANRGMNFPSWLAVPKNLCSSVVVEGTGAG